MVATTVVAVLTLVVPGSGVVSATVGGVVSGPGWYTTSTR